VPNAGTTARADMARGDVTEGARGATFPDMASPDDLHPIRDRGEAARDRFAEARAHMVERQLAARGIHDARVLEAMRTVPRDVFVPEGVRHDSHADRPLPIEAGQTISQPYIVALMVEAAQLGPDDIALEIGAGSGYATAVMSRLARRVIGIERHRVLCELAIERLERLGYDNAEIHCADGSAGWPREAPYAAILVAASGPRVPEPLRRQLTPGGRLVMPVGDSSHVQRLLKVTRAPDDSFREEELCGVAFVPLIGEAGWPDRDGAVGDDG
jgi:protein-L-isoaspartate(D-aspartate) O-methyltransferase